MYPTRCTYCISLLKNCKAYAKAHYYHIGKETYIDVKTDEEFRLILMMNKNQENVYKTYNKLLEITEENL